VDELLGLGNEERVRSADEVFQERISAALKALHQEDLSRLVVMIEALAKANGTFGSR